NGACIAVDGFLKLRQSLPDFLARRVKDEEPAFVLIHGPNGMGRTAAAREVLKHYRQIREKQLTESKQGTGPGRLMVPVVAKLNGSQLHVFRSWLLDLKTMLQKKTRPAELDKLVGKGFRDLLQSKEFDDSFVDGFREHLRKVNEVYGVGDKPLVFAF